MRKAHLQHVLEINLAMFFIATSGALGRYVDLPVPITIATRALLAFFVLYLFCKWKGMALRVNRKDVPILLVSGILMCAHWLTYFYALKFSNVAIGMLSLFTYPVLTAFLEPVVLKTKFQRVHLLLAFLVLLGMYFLTPEPSFENTYTIAIGLGFFSALSYALRNLLLKQKVAAYDGTVLMVYQTGIVALLLFPFLFTLAPKIILGQWQGLVALAVLTTAIGHTLFLMTFKHFNLTTVSIISSIQPIYGILIGVIFLAEIPTGNTVIGGVLILASVIIESVRSKKKEGAAANNHLE